MDHSSNSNSVNYNDLEKQALIVSMCCTLMNRVKLII